MSLPDRILLKVSTPATLSEKHLIYVYTVIKRYQDERRYGKIVLTFQDGKMSHLLEEHVHLIPKGDDPEAKI